jgi:hypothetical protein
MVTLPLNPIDLTEIYKNKLDDKEFTLAVNYTDSKDKMSSKQILIYLSNTAFKCAFDKVDDRLISDYLTINFLVDSPSLDRIVANIIKVKLGGEVKDSLGLFSLNQINNFIDNNENLVEDLIITMSSLPIFIAERVNSMDEDNTEIRNIPEYTEYSGSKIGLNMLNVLVYGFDAVLLSISDRGVTGSLNIKVYNEESKYRGVDIMKSLYDSGVVHSILQLFPDNNKKLKGVA